MLSVRKVKKKIEQRNLSWEQQCACVGLEKGGFGTGMTAVRRRKGIKSKNKAKITSLLSLGLPPYLLGCNHTKEALLVPLLYRTISTSDHGTFSVLLGIRNNLFHSCEPI